MIIYFNQNELNCNLMTVAPPRIQNRQIIKKNYGCSQNIQKQDTFL